jgi:uncharacterized protein YbjT (DUF2867 family)
MTDQTKTLLVTGATGQTGRNVTRFLLERGHRVRAFVHRRDDRSADLAAAGAEVVEGDLLDLDAVSAATAGTDAGYLCYPILPGLIDASAIFAQAARETGMGAIVNMSQISARRNAVSHAARNHWIAQQVLDWSPVPVTHLRPTFFAEWLITFLGPGDVLALPFGAGRHAPIAAVDQARVIAAVLADPAPHAGREYPLYGPVEMNHTEIAAAMSRALGRTVTYQPVEFDEFEPILRRRGLPDYTIQHLREVSIDYQNGIFAGTNDNVQAIGGANPLTVAEFVAQNLADFELLRAGSAAARHGSAARGGR